VCVAARQFHNISDIVTLQDLPEGKERYATFDSL
jgi:hypothetical protein